MADLSTLKPFISNTLTGRTSRRTKQLICEQVINLLLPAERLLHDTVSNGTYLINDDQSIIRISDGVDFRTLAWTLGINGSEPMYKWLLNDLDGAARTQGKQVALQRWFFATDQALYISSGPQQMAKVIIGDEDIHLVPNGTDGVLFAIEACLPAWTPCPPVDPLSLSALRPRIDSPDRVADYTAEVQRELLRVLLIALVANIRPLPWLLSLGSKGGGKTTLIKNIQRLFLGQFLAAPLSEDPRDFWTLTINKPVVVLDNVDQEKTPSWLPDAIAAVVTGIDYAKRSLYTDGDLYTQKVETMLCISTRTANFVRLDIAERALPIFTTPLNNRVADRDLERELDVNRPAALSWLALSAGKLVAHASQAPDNLPSRFVDFARLVWSWLDIFNAGTQALLILEAWEKSQLLSIIEGDELIEAIIDYLPSGIWSGRPGELTRYLTLMGADIKWQGGAKSISHKLREAVSTLALVGIKATEQRGSHTTWELIRQ